MIIREATQSDVENFKVRPQDDTEFWALCRKTGKEVLRFSFDNSEECCAVEVKGEVVCIFGCVPEDEGACIWILFTEITELPLSFFKKSKQYIKGLLDKYAFLYNYGSADNVFILKWAELLKFTIDEPVPYGLDGLMFRRFYIGRC
jgi:hypothetical protein